jgi:hypothetical protein
MHIVPVRIHCVLDYLVGVLLLAAPWLFGFADGGPAQWVAIVVGAVIIVYSLLKDYELGLATAIPLPVHLGLDVVAGIFLTMSPWLFGFADAIAWPHVLFGLIAIVVATLTPSHREPLERAETTLSRLS